MSDYTEWTVTHYEMDVKAVADAIRHVADGLEREAKPFRNYTHPEDDMPDYIRAAERAIHAVMWGMANVGIEKLVSSAGEVHRARKSDEVAS